MADAASALEHLADADGHIIEPGDLWVKRLPEDLRPLAPHYYRDPDGVFHSRIYGIEIESLPVMHGGIKPKDMLDNMGLSCAMGMPLERVFSGSDTERHTIVDAPRRVARRPLPDLHAGRGDAAAEHRARGVPRLQRLDDGGVLRRIGRAAHP